ncbi:hypothetical protein HY500_03555 [Candidatus Woesearchaeota archaeon]|nr:hypothetical protein [Candidatus Woesearchaeota archaeon]
MDVPQQIDYLEPETRQKVSLLLAETADERAMHSRGESELVRLVRGIEEKARFGSAKLFLETRRFEFAEELFLRNGSSFWMAEAERMHGEQLGQEEHFSRARKYLKTSLNKREAMPCPTIFRMAVGLYPKSDLERLFLPLAALYGGNIPLLITAFLANELGRTDEVETIYQGKKRELVEAEVYLPFEDTEDHETAEGVESPFGDEDTDDYESDAEHHMYVEDLRSEYAELCETLGRFDEAIDHILDGDLNYHILLHEPFSTVVERREDRNEIYERALLRHFGRDPFHRALALEKVGRADEARGYYHKAMLDGEDELDFGEAFSIARRLGSSKKVEAYDAVATHLYAHGHI